MSTNSQHFTKVAQEPNGEAHGRLLYWDSTYHVFSLVNTRESETKVVDLGPFKAAVLRLQHEHGLTLGQANQAALSAMGAFNEGINLDIIQRIASGPDEASISLISATAMKLGADVDGLNDEEFVAEAVKIARAFDGITSMIEAGVTNFRYDLSGLDRKGRQDLARQLVGIRKTAESLHALLRDGFAPEGQ